MPSAPALPGPAGPGRCGRPLAGWRANIWLTADALAMQQAYLGLDCQAQTARQARQRASDATPVLTPGLTRVLPPWGRSKAAAPDTSTSWPVRVVPGGQAPCYYRPPARRPRTRLEPPRRRDACAATGGEAKVSISVVLRPCLPLRLRGLHSGRLAPGLTSWRLTVAFVLLRPSAEPSTAVGRLDSSCAVFSRVMAPLGLAACNTLLQSVGFLSGLHH